MVIQGKRKDISDAEADVEAVAGKIPLAGSCACCERDETRAAGGGADLKKCSKCKLTRCGPRSVRGTSARAGVLIIFSVCVLWLIRVDTADVRVVLYDFHADI